MSETKVGCGDVWHDGIGQGVGDSCPACGGSIPGPASGSPDDLAAVVSDFVAWAEETFPDATPATCIAHLASEVEELRGSPDDPEELADAAMLIFHAAYRARVDLTAAIKAKLVKNRTREWGPPNEEGFREHIRAGSPDDGDGVLSMEEWVSLTKRIGWRLVETNAGRPHDALSAENLDDWTSLEAHDVALRQRLRDAEEEAMGNARAAVIQTEKLAAAEGRERRLRDLVEVAKVLVPRHNDVWHERARAAPGEEGDGG